MESSHPGNRKEEMKKQDEVIEKSLVRIKEKIIVLSGKGGVGKSTTAINLAVALAEKGFKVGLLDVDLHGPNVAGMLGLSSEKATVFLEHIMPLHYSENLEIISMQSFLSEDDSAVIWRGPKKIGAIRQFISDVLWGDLDYLIIDSPPGTGDEPLTVAQVIKGARAIIVTTPQEVSLADVRKSINFCRQVSMPIIGLIENMSGFRCPHCGKVTDIFKKDGALSVAQKMHVPLLGKIPIDPEIVKSGDEGKPYLSQKEGAESVSAFKEIVDQIISFYAASKDKLPLQTEHHH
jgi:Mrp family chromosome partitioning ATPase